MQNANPMQTTSISTRNDPKSLGISSGKRTLKKASEAEKDYEGIRDSRLRTIGRKKRGERIGRELTANDRDSETDIGSGDPQVASLWGSPLAEERLIGRA